MRESQSGQSLFEVVVTLAVVGLVLISLVTVASISLRNTSYSRNKTLASRISQETVEWLRSQRDSSWSDFSSQASIPKRCFTSLSWAEAKIGDCGADDFVGETIFKREVELSLDVENVTAKSRVFWEDAQGTHEIVVSTVFTDWRSQ